MNVDAEIKRIIEQAPAEIAGIRTAGQFNAFVGKIDEVALTALNDAQVAKLNPFLRSAQAHRELTRLRLEALRHIGKLIFEGADFPGLEGETAVRASSLARMEETTFSNEIEIESKV